MDSNKGKNKENGDKTTKEIENYDGSESNVGTEVNSSGTKSDPSKMKSTGSGTSDDNSIDETQKLSDLTPEDEGEYEGEVFSETEEDSQSIVLFSTSSMKKSETGYTGLSNQGATCYLNSLIQTMFMTPELRRKLFAWRYNKENHGSEERSIPLQLQRLFGKLLLVDKRSIGTKKLTKSFGWDRSQSFVQHDVNELCRVLFEALDKTFAPNLYKKNSEYKKCKNDEERKKVMKKYEDLIKKNNEELVSDLFRGAMIDYVVAKDIKDKNGKEIGRKRVDHFLDVQLVIRDKKSIEQALADYIIPETLDGDNKWHCDQLNKKVTAIKGLKFKSFPPLLTLNLKRFDYDPVSWTRVKLGHKVTFPFILDVKPYIAFDENPEGMSSVGETKYELYSILIHSGTARAGHYYAYVKSFESGKWICFNDSTVKGVTEEDVKKMYGSDSDSGSYSSTNAYMLMYRNVGLKKHGKIGREMLPDYVKKEINLKNEKMKGELERAKRMADRVYVRFYTHQKDFVTQINVPKKYTIRKLTMRIHRKLKRMYGKDTFKSIPLDCFRLRKWSHFTKGTLFPDVTKSLEELKFSRINTLVIESKKKEAEWPVEIKYVSLFICPLFHSSSKFGQPFRLHVKSTKTVKELKVQFADMFQKATKEKLEDCTFKNVNIWEFQHKKDLPEKIIDLNFDNTLPKTMGELGLEEAAMIYAEYFQKISRGYDILYKDIMQYRLKFNLPGSYDFDQTIFIDKYKSLNDLKVEIGKRIDLPVDKFRIFNFRHNKSVFKHPDKPLKKSPLFSGCKVLVEAGEPLKENEFLCEIYLFISKEQLREEEKEGKLKEEEEEKKKKEEEAKKRKEEFEKKKKLIESEDVKENKVEKNEKKEDVSNVIEDPEGDDENENENGEEGPPPMEDMEKEKEEKKKKRERELTKEELEYRKLVREKKELDAKINAEEDDPDANLTALEKFWRQRKQRRMLTKLVFSVDDNFASVKEKIAKYIIKRMNDGTVISPHQIRIRKENLFGLGRIYKNMETSVKKVHPMLRIEKKLIIETLKKEEKLKESELLVNVRHWSSTEWKFLQTFKFVYDKNIDKEKNGDLKDQLCKHLNLKRDDIMAQVFPSGLDLTKRTVGLLDWTKENIKNITDDATVVYKLVSDTGCKFDIKLLKKHMTLIDPTRASNYVREQALIIKTEFDEEMKKKKKVEEGKKSEKEKGEEDEDDETMVKKIEK